MSSSNQSLERRARWLWRIAMALALLGVTALTFGCQREQVEDEEPIEAGTGEPTEDVQLEAAFLEPGENVDMTVTGQAPVTEVVSDRGFWLGHKGKRLFTVVREDMPREEMIDINAGQRLELKGQLLESEAVEDSVAGELEPETRDIIEGQEYFLAVHHRDVQIVSEPQAGADQTMLEMGANEYGSFADYDADDNNLLTARELTRGLEDREFFSEWDRNNDQKLDEREFASHLYTVVDVNQNDRIDRDEFVFLQDNFDAFADATFSGWDDNRNDWLDNEEFFTQIEDAEIFDQWDANETDYVEYNEYGEGIVGLWDENEDGFLELGEFGFEEDMEVTLN